MNMYDPNYVANPVLFELGVKTVIVDGDGRVLLIQRSDKSTRPHGWDLPGGGVDRGEDPRDAAVREVGEETSLKVHTLKLLTTYLSTESPQQAVLLGYAAQADSHDVQLSWEHEAFRWVSLDELKDIELPDLHTAILQAYVQHIG